MEDSKPALWEWGFAILCGLLGAAIVLAATARYGLGVSSDSMYYLASADNFLAGKGFVDFGDIPLTDFPPLYPFILAILSGITSVTPFVWARVINAGTMALLMAATGLLFWRAFPARRPWFILGTLASLVFYPLYKLAANVCTDVIFIFLAVCFCLAASDYLEKRGRPALLIMVLIAASAAMLRWVGLSFVISLFLLVFYAQRDRPFRAWWLAALSSGLAGLPLMLWQGVRNYYLVGTSGRMGYVSDRINELKNIELTISQLLGWATPYPLAFCLGLALFFLLPVMLLSRVADWQRFFHRLAGPRCFPVLLLSTVYLVTVIASSWTADHLALWDDRYQVPLYAALLLVFFAILEELLLPRLSRSLRATALAGVSVAFIIWGGFQTANILKFVQASQEQGVIVYNEYNHRKLRNSTLVVYLLKNPPPPQSTLYSNVPEAVYFFLRQTVKMAPWDPENYVAAPENVGKYYAGWQPEREAYLIFFKPNYKRHHFIPKDIRAVVRLEKFFKDSQGEFYRIWPKE